MAEKGEVARARAKAQRTAYGRRGHRGSAPRRRENSRQRAVVVVQEEEGEERCERRRWCGAGR